MSTDRPNIFIQKIVTKKALWLGYVNEYYKNNFKLDNLIVFFNRNIDKDLSFLLPIICDSSLPKIIIFVPKRIASVTGMTVWWAV